MSNKPPARASALKVTQTISGPTVFGREPDHEHSFKAPFPDKLMEGPFPCAYALIEEAPGRYSAVLLEGVTARRLSRLEVNGQPEPQGRAMMRMISAIEKRTVGKKWSNP
jgi:hypothetical protein